MKEVEEKEIDETTAPKLWSDPKSWVSGMLPKEGEDVDIFPGNNMIMDMEKTPIFKLVTVNGRLTFKNDIDIQFNAKHIFVRAGELIIGTKEKPYLKNCKITLHGEKETEAIVYDNAIEAGNKVIANVGWI